MSNPFDRSIKIQLSETEIVKERVPNTKVPSGSFYHTVKSGETIQSIAFKYYGDSGRWGDIADINNIYNPFTELEEDSQILIP